MSERLEFFASMESLPPVRETWAGSAGVPRTGEAAYCDPDAGGALFWVSGCVDGAGAEVPCVCGAEVSGGKVPGEPATCAAPVAARAAAANRGDHRKRIVGRIMLQSGAQPERRKALPASKY